MAYRAEQQALRKTEQPRQELQMGMQLEKRVAQAKDATPVKVPEINVRQASDATKQTLQREGLLNQRPESNRVEAGKKGEAMAKTVLKHEGLRHRDGSKMPLRGVADGQHSGRHGLDLVGITDKGRPVPIEVKHVQTGKASLNDKPLTTVEAKNGSPVRQMDNNWVRDRYRQMIANPEQRKELFREGMDVKYLNPRNFSKDDAKLWNDVLSEKTVVTVSPQGNDAVGNKLQQQAQNREIRRINAIRR